MKTSFETTLNVVLKIIVYSYLTLIGLLALAFSNIFLKWSRLLKIFTTNNNNHHININKPAGA